MSSPGVSTDSETLCYHCGTACAGEELWHEEKAFCCQGCQVVYSILKDNSLDTYYRLEDRPGTVPDQRKTNTDYAGLDDPDLCRKLLEYQDDTISKITLHIPAIHCASCVWLLEHFHKLLPGVQRAEINFLRKELSLTYRQAETSLREIAETLDRIGYTPDLQREDARKPGRSAYQRSLLTRLGVAGFCFGNIMLFSFPEYLAGEIALGEHFTQLFGFLNIALALPVFLYSGWEFFGSSIQALRNKTVNIDVPIALGILVLFLRSVVEIVFTGGAGFMDSLAGLVFLLLIGRWFQAKTFDHLSFDRDYRAYFPLAVTLKQGREERSIPLEKLRSGDTICVRNGELIPADARLASEHCSIDYSFVTGESRPVERGRGDLLYAGGRILGTAADMAVVRETSQSYLTRLWNNEIFARDKQESVTTLTNRFSKFFTAAVIGIAVCAALYWLPESAALAANAFTATLIIACPCALALAAPFTLGNALKHLSRNKFYLKNATVVEQLAEVNSIVFDKTGTLTQSDKANVHFHGSRLSDTEEAAILAAARQTNHPLARMLRSGWSASTPSKVIDSSETANRGVRCLCANGHTVLLGSRQWLEDNGASPEVGDRLHGFSQVLLAVDGTFRGYFAIEPAYRDGVAPLLVNLNDNTDVHLLSGDNAGQKAALLPFFAKEQNMHFHQSPQDKLEYVRDLQEKGQKIMMIGDGLNDAGALHQSTVGVALVENTGAFCPASDAILDAGRLATLPRFLRFSRACMTIIKASIGISLAYNVLGLSFAVQGSLSPLICAILMPVSSVTVIVFTTVVASWYARRLGEGV